MNDLNSYSQGSLNPNIQWTDSRQNRYANPFFDMSQQYMPPTIKELFKWCTFYYYNSPLIGSTITKISRYPITDLIIEDEHESVRSLWSNIFNNELKIKERMLEINLDYHTYGNAFVSLSFPFTRFLKCKACGDSSAIDQTDWQYLGNAYEFQKNCKACGVKGQAEVKDVPYKDRKQVRLIRWNPENMQVKYNEYTGKTVYMYSIPPKLRSAIQRGDKDIIADTPLIVLDAIKERRMIRLNPDNFRHLKRPTLAEQDQGWGKPLIIHVLKDMYYFYTLRRAQEAIALEHIVPFDIIYPMPNAQQDPYVHTDLANWKTQIQTIIQKHRKDPNFKGVIPIPVGFGRLGGDGKAMMLTPELNYLTQTIVGGMGIPQEFLFGGLNWTGSSISLRTLENDFIQNRSQMLDIIHWVKDKIRLYCQLPNIKSIRFTDFRMADDVQRNQQLIGLNAQMKVSDQTLLTELGYDYEQEVKKMMEEAYIQNYLNDLRAKGNAKTQGEASIIQWNYQNKVQELSMQAQEAAQKKMQAQGLMTPDQQGMPMDPNDPMAQQAGGESPLNSQGLAPNDMDPSMAAQQEAQPQMSEGKMNAWVKKLTQLPMADAMSAIAEIKAQMPEVGGRVEMLYNKAMTSQSADAGRGKSTENANSLEVNMNPLPEKGAPTRAGMV